MKRVEIFKQIGDDPQQQPLCIASGQALSKLQWRHELHALEPEDGRSHLNRVVAVLLTVSRMAGAWQRDTTDKTLGRVLRGSMRPHTV